MRVLITGADYPLGHVARQELHGDHELVLAVAGQSSQRPGESRGEDIGDPVQAAKLLCGVDAVMHLEPHQRCSTAGAADERRALDRAARATFVLLHAAREAGVKRFILASRLDLMDRYPPDAAVDETWRPLPSPDASSLVPWLAELTTREFVRAEEMTAVCLRFGELGPGRDSTPHADAARALRLALEMDPKEHRYRWWVFHIGSTDRFPLGAAANPPLAFRRE